MKPRFFRAPAEFRAWLQKHHAAERELLVGFWKRDTGRPSLTWPESVDEALCFGWIDGVRRSLGETSYTIRFTPRKRGSRWSAVNIARAKALKSEGRMTPAGLAAFEAHGAHPQSGYSVSNRPERFEEPYATALKRHRAAHAYFESQPPSYRKTAIFWVTSARQEATRLRRLEQLIADSAAGRRLGQMTRFAKPGRGRGPATRPRRRVRG